MELVRTVCVTPGQWFCPTFRDAESRLILASVKACRSNNLARAVSESGRPAAACEAAVVILLLYSVLPGVSRCPRSERRGSCERYELPEQVGFGVRTSCLSCLTRLTVP